MSKEEKILEELFPIMDEYVERTLKDKKEIGFAISGNYEPIYPSVGEETWIYLKVPDLKEKIEKGEVIGQFHTHPPPYRSGLPSTSDTCYSSFFNIICCIGGEEEVCCLGPDEKILGLCREHDHYAELYPLSESPIEKEEIWHRMGDIRGQIDVMVQRNVICKSREKNAWGDVRE